MNNVVDEVLAGEPRYKLTYNDNTTASNVKIELTTQVTTAGTPLNRTLFESIRTDLNSRMLTSNKATQAQAEAGTDDTKYMTPLKTKQAINKLATTTTFSAGHSTETLYTFNNSSTATIRIIGNIGSPAYHQTSYPSLVLNGSLIFLNINDTWESPTSSKSITVGANFGTSSTNRCPFFLEFDMATKTINGFLFTESSVGTQFSKTAIYGVFTSLTSLTISKDTSIPVTIKTIELV